MKTTIIIFCIAFSSIIYAQKIEIGPEVGLNFIKTYEAQTGNQFQPGWHGGGLFRYRMSDLFSIRTGVYYTQKRQSYVNYDTAQSAFLTLAGLDSFSIDGFDFNTYSQTDGKTLQHYIQIPLLAEIQFENFVFFGGGYVGYMFASKSKELEVKRTPFTSTIDLGGLLGGIEGTEFLTALFPPAYEENYSESQSSSFLNAFDFGLKAGLGYKLDNLEINCSYLYGIPDYRSGSDYDTRINHQYFQLGLNYTFGFGPESGFTTKRSKRINLKR